MEKNERKFSLDAHLKKIKKNEARKNVPRKISCPVQTHDYSMSTLYTVWAINIRHAVYEASRQKF